MLCDDAFLCRMYVKLDKNDGLFITTVNNRFIISEHLLDQTSISTWNYDKLQKTHLFVSFLYFFYQLYCCIAPGLNVKSDWRTDIEQEQTNTHRDFNAICRQAIQ